MVMDMGEVNMGSIRQYTRNYRPTWRLPIPPWITLVIASILVYLANSSISCGPSVNSEEVSESLKNISIFEATPSSVMLKWTDGKMTELAKELIHKIEYKSQWDTDLNQWHSINISGICNSPLTANTNVSLPKINCRHRNTNYNYFNVTDLIHPSAAYDFCIFARSSASDVGDKWSPIGCIALKTKPTIPVRPPRTTVGSFESVISTTNNTTRDVSIYWQNIDNKEKCGDLFEYRIFYTSADNETIIYHANETNKNNAKFEGLSTSTNYNFKIYSANEEGLSTEYSTVYVPKESNKLRKPTALTKMEFAEQGVVELSWKNGGSWKISTSNQPMDFTLFWCENDKDHPRQCNGNINWTNVPYTETSFNVTELDPKKNYRFAMSTNSKTLPKNGSLHQSFSNSSGMVWESCTLLQNKIVGKMENLWFSYISSTFMELNWKLECSDKIGSVLGYRLFYCPVVSISNATCMEPMTTQMKGGEIAHRARTFSYIRNLKPYTTYMVTISLVTNLGEGLPSDPLFKTTLEGAPDVRNFSINVTGLTNNSVDLQWSPPKFANGVIRNYIVTYYVEEPQQQKQQDVIDLLDETNIIYKQRNVTVHDTKCRLDNLENNRIYNITVIACTIKCSERSLPIQVRTTVGLPGVPVVKRAE